MLRRNFLALPFAVRPAAEPLILLAAGDVHRLRAAARRTALAGKVEKALKDGPWSVTSHRPPRSDAAPNDYYSEGPYWWPDPKNPNGPYIRKDGERNPARFLANRQDIAEMSEAVLTLGLGAALLEDARCAERAAKILSAWFLDAKTRMNPHLEYGQAVIGHNTGRGAGMIDTVALIRCAQGVALLGENAVTRGVRAWFAGYLRWMTTSPKGLDEEKAGNNHATWWTAQVAAYATLARDEAAKKLAWEQYRTHLVPSQIEPDGSCPKEEARTRSLSYSAMNLDGYAVLCRIAQLNGVDLWRFRTPKGTGIEKAFHYLLPFLLDPKSWRKPQISGFDRDQIIYPGLAGLGLGSPELLAAYRKLPRADAPWVTLVDLLVKS
ncbi:MAG: alginate lyase family protein [Acidobacteria bacterium]|nr:alginate lyase family protein [Acidobacteriota bacterium]